MGGHDNGLDTEPKGEGRTRDIAGSHHYWMAEEVLFLFLFLSVIGSQNPVRLSGRPLPGRIKDTWLRGVRFKIISVISDT